MLIITTPMIEGKKAVVCEDEQQRETMETHVNVIAILWIISGIFDLIWFPFWTALGVYSIVVLLKDETVQLFRA